MSIADVVISLITWIFQKTILPILPVNLPYISYTSFSNALNGSLKHNLIYSFAGLSNLFNLQLLFTLLLLIILAETFFWLFRVGLFLVKLVRG